jgi:hypothetical protein
MGRDILEGHLESLAVGLNVQDAFYQITVFQVLRLMGLVRLYGLIGVFLFFFGNWRTWAMEAKVLEMQEGSSVEAFKRSVLDECNMIAISVRSHRLLWLHADSQKSSIVAIFAITAFATLDFLSQTHWIARALLVYSMNASLMAVYYAVKQQRTLGRLITPLQVRRWIRGPIYHGTNTKMKRRLNIACEPSAYVPRKNCTEEELRLDVLRCCFRPDVASVLTVSAPHLLLSSSILSLFVTMGVYLGFVYTRELDEKAGPNDSRNVFIFFIVTLFLSQLVLAVSAFAEDEERILEFGMLQSNLNQWLGRNDDVVRGWGYSVEEHEDGTVSMVPLPGGRGWRNEVGKVDGSGEGV